MPGVLLYRCPSVSLWPILSQFALMKPTVANRCTQVLPIVAHPWPCPVNPVYCQPHKGLSQLKTAMSTREQSSGQTAPSSPFITLNLFLQDSKPCIHLAYLGQVLITAQEHTHEPPECSHYSFAGLFLSPLPQCCLLFPHIQP